MDEAFRARMMRGDVMAGTFLKTPAYELIEVLALAGLDFVCLDAEHAPFDRGRMDACLAMARALGFPALVRVGSGSQENILQALDSGAAGIVVPHVFSAERAREVARWGRYGHHGRGYAGSTRWAGYTTRTMPELLAENAGETVIIAQIEEPEGVDAAAEIAAVEGIDGLFLGPADLTVAYGADDGAAAKVEAALASVGGAARAAGKAWMTFVPTPAKAAEWRRHGVSMFFLASEQGWLLNAARDAVAGIREIG